MGVTRDDPQKCRANDFVLAELVQDWPRMAGREVVAFQKWTGLKTQDGYLVRQGRWIFLVTPGATLAQCVYAHERSFR